MNETKYYTVYKITNLYNLKVYIGYHETYDLEDGYMGSGKLIKRSIDKMGLDGFSKECIDIFNNKKDAEHLESILVNADFVKSKDSYNITLGGNIPPSHLGVKRSNETIMKMKKPKSKEQRIKMGERSLGNTYSLGIKRSEEVNKARSEAFSGERHNMYKGERAIVDHISGEVFIVKIMSEWCIANGVSYNSLRSSKYKKIKLNGRWTWYFVGE